jgi:UMF1 family MFS transporter
LGKLNELVSQQPTHFPSDSDESVQVISESEDAHLLEGNSSEILAARQEYSVALSSATSRISSRGIASGYLAGIILLIIALVPVSKLHGSTLSLRLAIGMSGVWWAFFSLPAAALLPAGTIVELVDDAGAFEKWTVRGQILAAWKRLGGMLRWSEIKKLRNTFRYLAAWFLLSDGQSGVHISFRLSILI